MSGVADPVLTAPLVVSVAASVVVTGMVNSLIVVGAVVNSLVVLEARMDSLVVVEGVVDALVVVVVVVVSVAVSVLTIVTVGATFHCARSIATGFVVAGVDVAATLRAGTVRVMVR